MHSRIDAKQTLTTRNYSHSAGSSKRVVKSLLVWTRLLFSLLRNVCIPVLPNTYCVYQIVEKRVLRQAFNGQHQNIFDTT